MNVVSPYKEVIMANEMEALIRQILADMQTTGQVPVPNQQVSTTTSGQQGPINFDLVSTADYPVAKNHPEWIDIGEGRDLSYITMDNVMAGKITMNDLKISPDILKVQGKIAKSGGRDQIELNFSRAAEMTKVSDERLLAMYNALRPYRSSKAELLDIANELDGLGAPICANFVREAAENYERRKKLKGDN